MNFYSKINILYKRKKKKKSFFIKIISINFIFFNKTRVTFFFPFLLKYNLVLQLKIYT